MVEPPPKKMRVETSDDEVDTEKGEEEEGKAKVVEEVENVEGEKEGEKESEKKEEEGDGSKHAAESLERKENKRGSKLMAWRLSCLEISLRTVLD